MEIINFLNKFESSLPFDNLQISCSKVLIVILYNNYILSKPYYTLPLGFGKLCEKKDLEHCTLKESISQHLYLIITTALGDCLYDETFGCSIWDSDFDNKINDSRLKEQIKSGLCSSIKNHENRLDDLGIEISFSQALVGVGENVTSMKKKLDLVVTGTLAQTDEPFAFSGYFFMGPLSYY